MSYVGPIWKTEHEREDENHIAFAHVIDFTLGAKVPFNSRFNYCWRQCLCPVTYRHVPSYV